MKTASIVGAAMLLIALLFSWPASSNAQPSDQPSPPPPQVAPDEQTPPPPPRQGPPGEKPPGPPDRSRFKGERSRGPAGEHFRHGRETWRPRLEPEERRTMLEFLQTELPQIYQDATEWLERDPDQAHPMLLRQRPMLLHLMRLREEDPNLFALEKSDIVFNWKEMKLVREFHAASTQEQKDACKTELRQLLNQHADVRLALRRAKLERMRQEIKKLEGELAEREQKKDELVDRQFARLLGQPRQDEW